MFVGYPRPKPSTTPTPTARMGQQGPPTRSSMTDEDRETLIQIFSTRNSRRTAETATLESVPSQKNEPSGEEILVSLTDEPEDPTTSAFVPATSKDGEKVNSLGDELLEAFSSYSGDPFALTMEGPPGIQTEDLEPAAEDPAKDAGRNDGMWEMWPENPFGQPIPSPSLAAGGDFVDLMLFSEHDVATITENGVKYSINFDEVISDDRISGGDDDVTSEDSDSDTDTITDVGPPSPATSQDAAPSAEEGKAGELDQDGSSNGDDDSDDDESDDDDNTVIFVPNSRLPPV